MLSYPVRQHLICLLWSFSDILRFSVSLSMTTWFVSLQDEELRTLGALLMSLSRKNGLIRKQQQQQQQQQQQHIDVLFMYTLWPSFFARGFWQRKTTEGLMLSSSVDGWWLDSIFNVCLHMCRLSFPLLVVQTGVRCQEIFRWGTILISVLNFLEVWYLDTLLWSSPWVGYVIDGSFTPVAQCR